MFLFYSPFSQIQQQYSKMINLRKPGYLDNKFKHRLKTQRYYLSNSVTSMPTKKQLKALFNQHPPQMQVCQNIQKNDNSTQISHQKNNLHVREGKKTNQLKEKVHRKNIKSILYRSQQHSSQRYSTKTKSLSALEFNQKTADPKFPLLKRQQSQFARKLSIIYKQICKLFKNKRSQSLPRAKSDFKSLLFIFTGLFNDQLCVSRHMSSNYHSTEGKILFLIGYEVHIKYLFEEWVKKQMLMTFEMLIYLSLKAGMIEFCLQSYKNCIDLCLNQKNYASAKIYTLKCLHMAIHYGNKYYEDTAVEKLGLCQYYEGNVLQAAYLHDNIGRISEESKSRIKNKFNAADEQEQLQRYIFRHGKADMRKRNEFEENDYMKSIIFISPRVANQYNIEERFKNAIAQTQEMQKLAKWKNTAVIIKKNLRKIRKMSSVQSSCQNNRRSFKADYQYRSKQMEVQQSAQVIKSHQSENRYRRHSKESRFVSVRKRNQQTQYINLLKLLLRQVEVME